MSHLFHHITIKSHVFIPADIDPMMFPKNPMPHQTGLWFGQARSITRQTRPLQHCGSCCRAKGSLQVVRAILPEIFMSLYLDMRIMCHTFSLYSHPLSNYSYQLHQKRQNIFFQVVVVDWYLAEISCFPYFFSPARWGSLDLNKGATPSLLLPSALPHSTSCRCAKQNAR